MEEDNTIMIRTLREVTNILSWVYDDNEIRSKKQAIDKIVKELNNLLKIHKIHLGKSKEIKIKSKKLEKMENIYKTYGI